MLLKFGFWSNKSHYLNKMTLKELTVAYFQYYAIQAYIVLALGALYVALTSGTSLWLDLAAAGLAVALYPLAWYVLHRWVLHSQFMFKSPLTARVWKRIHFDHHQDPDHLEVLFGALYTTLPTVAIVTIPTGYLIHGVSGAAAGFAAGLITTCFYEYCHCIQHLSYKPKNKMMAEIKRLHMAHHFHDETGNFGITNFFWDKTLGTQYDSVKGRPKSATVFNLGYDEEMAKKYPWVAEITGDIYSTSTRRDKLKVNKANVREQAV